MSSSPRISLIIPSFNQAAYLDETLESILGQQDPNTEIIVIDGGSTDGTLALLQKHSERLAHWVSEPDAGQTEAINKGLRQISGDIWAYVNADDPLLPGALEAVRKAFEDPAVFWAGGIGEVFDKDGIRGEIRCRPVSCAKDWLAPWNRPHPYVIPFSGCNFMRREVLEKIGFFDPGYHYSMDIEYGVRAVFVGGFRPTFIPQRMAGWRWHPESKTMKRGIAYAFREDEIRIAEQYAKYLPSAERTELSKEIRMQSRLMVPRKAMGLRNQGERCAAAWALAKGAFAHTSVLTLRPWWGAVRRLFTK